MPARNPGSGLYTRIASGVLFPLHERAKGHHSVALHRELEQSQWWTHGRILRSQADRLRSFLCEIGTHVPYYRDLFRKAGFDPAAVGSVEDLRSLPHLDKPTIRAHTDALKSDRAGKLVRYNTGGSSGEPLVFYMGMGRVSHDVAAKWRATRWWNVDMHHQMDGYLESIRRLRPRMLFGYASALALLAGHAERQGRDMTDLGIRVAFATGETLYPEQRAVIERVFAAPVANGYGSRDAGFIAHQCPSGSLHLSAEHVVVELIDAAGRAVEPGEKGEIVVTHLATGDFPFVRYRTGDMAVMGTEPCACGRGLPVLREVFGRSTDFVRTVSGNTMHALALIYEVRDRPGVRAFKFVQGEDLSLELLLAAGPELTGEVEAGIRAGILKRMGEGTVLTIRRVDEIPPEKSGKYRYVVSRAR